jgi:hypothetical protein
LRELGFPDKYFENFIWPLVIKAVQADQLKQELTRLEEHQREIGQRR